MQPKVVTLSATFSLKTKLLLFSLAFLLFTFIFLLLPKPSLAQNTSSNSATIPSTVNAAPYSQPYISPQSPNSATLAIYNFGHAISCILIGQSPIAPCLEYKMYQDAQGVVRSVPYLSSVNTNQGVFGVGTSILASMYTTRPLSSSEFIANLEKQIGIRSANAQVGGSGSAVLSPVFKLWEVSRNVAYLVMIIVFVLVGVMVMFRQRLNPQTVVSIQLALPGLVIGLVLITFSYFLASLISDIAFLGTDLVGYYFQAAQTKQNDPSSLLQLIDNQSSITLMGRLGSTLGNADISSAINSLLSSLSGNTYKYVEGAVLFLSYQYGGQAGSTILTPIGAILGFARGGFSGAGAGITIAQILGTLGAGALTSIIGGAAPGTLLSYIVGFVFVAMIIYTIFKLILKLLSNFLSIIFYTIAAPFIFLIASLPGRQGLVSSWILNMLCHVLAFPSVLGVLYFSYYLLTNGQPLQAGNQAFVVPQVTTGVITGNATFPLFGGLDLSVLNILLAFGAFIATPSIPDIICKSIGKIGPAAGMIEGEITGAQRSGQGYVRQATAAPGQIGKDIGNVRQLGDEWAASPVTGTWQRAKFGAINTLLKPHK